MSDTTEFSAFLDRSKQDRLEGEFLGLAAELEAQGHHPLAIINALQNTIETRLDRQGWLDTDLYWRKMKAFADGWCKFGKDWTDAEQARRDAAHSEAKTKGRKTKRGQSLH